MAWKQCGYTEVASAVKVCYDWKIQNLTQHHYETGEQLISPTFYSGSNNADEFELKMYPGALNKDCQDYVSLFLNIKACKSFPVKLSGELSFIDSKHNVKLHQRPFVRVFSQKERDWGWHKFILKSNLFDEEKEFLVDDVITVRCDLEVYSGKPQSSSYSVPDTLIQSTVDKHRIGNDLKQFFTQCNYFDVTLMVGINKFAAHKLILALRSSVFSAMFSNLMVENQTNEVIIEDLTPNTVKEMLHYIYTDEVNSDAFSMELLVAAEKYDLNGLKAMCELILLERLTEQNAAEILVFADLHNAKELKNRVICFIHTHQSQVAKSEGYNKLVKANPTLLAELYQVHMARLREPTTERDTI